MNFLGKTFLLVSLFFSSFNTKSECRILSDKFVIGSSITAGTACAAIIGLYLWTHRTHKKPAPKTEAEKLLRAIDDEEEAQGAGILSNTLKFTLIPGAVGGGFYYVLSGYTLDGYLNYCVRKAKKVNLGLNEKFSSGKQDFVKDKDIDVDVLKKFIDANFGKDSHCPLIEAERLLLDQHGFLQAAIKTVRELNNEIESNENTIPAEKQNRFNSVSESITNLSDRITSAVQAIKKCPEYKDQLATFIAYKKDLDQKEAVSSQRKYELLKILAIVGGAYGIAGKVVAPFC
jgi:hypothetical protein